MPSADQDTEEPRTLEDSDEVGSGSSAPCAAVPRSLNAHDYTTNETL